MSFRRASVRRNDVVPGKLGTNLATDCVEVLGSSGNVVAVERHDVVGQSSAEQLLDDALQLRRHVLHLG